MVNQEQYMNIIFLFYDQMTALDAIGPQEILCRLPSAKIYRVALHAGPIQTDSGQILIAEHSIKEISAADVLVVPGAGSATTLQKHPEALAWVRKIHATTTWTTSVCTGSLILGAAGLLKGLAAASHWAALDRLKIFGAHPSNQRVVEAGKIITAAGVSAGIDMALILAAKIAGQPIAETLQLGIQYDPEPPFNTGSPTKANPVALVRLQEYFATSFEKIEVIDS